MSSYFPCFHYLQTNLFHRDEEVFDSLLAYAAYTDFALKAMIGEAELLVFTSLQLPGKLQSKSKYNYLCRRIIMLFCFFM